MKLTWRDIVTTLIIIGGAAVVYAKYYNFSWMGLENWRDGIAALTVGGLIMLVFSGFNFFNRSILNISEIIIGAAAIIIAVVGVISGYQSMFYSLAIVLGVLWLVDTARHVRHSWIRLESAKTSTFHWHAHVH